MLELVRKWANQKLYGIENCDDIVSDVKDYLYQQRVYQNPECNIDTSCFTYDSHIAESDFESSVCNLIILSASSCNITISEI